MIILLGETAAAREISKCLYDRGFELQRLQSWSEKTCILTPSLTIDASPPSSSNKFTPLRRWCDIRGITYLRLERPETIIPDSLLIYPVSDWEEALFRLEQRINFLYKKRGQPITIFITTGSHQLESLVRSSFARFARLVVRVLPEGRLVQKCRDMGIPARDIAALQGPFSKEVNRVLFKFYGADIVLTRDSGPAGGTDTKLSAALDLGLEIILIKRNNVNPGLTVNSVQELLDWIEANVPKSKETF